MKRVEPEIWANYVDTGAVQYIYWPVFSYGDASLNSYKVMECAGQQDFQLAWAAHEVLYENTSDLMRVNPELYVAIAEQIGLDMSTYSTCFDDPATEEIALQLDQIAKDRGITSHPIFEFVGVGYLIGSQPFSIFEDAFETIMNQ